MTRAVLLALCIVAALAGAAGIVLSVVWIATGATPAAVYLAMTATAAAWALALACLANLRLSRARPPGHRSRLHLHG
ncbi:hypothetical protein [Pseudonocardia sp. N23]|uniref:hypothetical protein n=1 Tax=Pseudonocardia sp. N23 TaxID=1987376 RepID=UPI000BFB254A|nr:hypothetical protein [Pseudonocardia sp. N23]GAY09834.1 hypothetical protein TOK_4189 [Pseudonocardia sp. N23]